MAAVTVTGQAEPEIWTSFHLAGGGGDPSAWLILFSQAEGWIGSGSGKSQTSIHMSAAISGGG